MSRQVRRRRPWVATFVVAVAVVGVISGIVWNRVVDLPSYVIAEDFRAVISEADRAQMIAADVWFAGIGVVAGLIIGITALVLFARIGWSCTLIATGAGVVAGLIARWVGEFLGPRDFTTRIAQASRGDLVRVDFSAHTWVTLAVWVGVSVLPVLVGSLVRRGPRSVEPVPEPAAEA